MEIPLVGGTSVISFFLFSFLGEGTHIYPWDANLPFYTPGLNSQTGCMR